MNTELLEALTILEEEKDISRDTLMDAIETSYRSRLSPNLSDVSQHRMQRT